MNARRVAWLLLAGALVIAFAIWLSSPRHLGRATSPVTWCCPAWANPSHLTR
jgi:hypothetical protein